MLANSTTITATIKRNGVCVGGGTHFALSAYIIFSHTKNNCKQNLRAHRGKQEWPYKNKVCTSTYINNVPRRKPTKLQGRKKKMGNKTKNAVCGGAGLILPRQHKNLPTPKNCKQVHLRAHTEVEAIAMAAIQEHSLHKHLISYY